MGPQLTFLSEINSRYSVHSDQPRHHFAFTSLRRLDDGKLDMEKLHEPVTLLKSFIAKSVLTQNNWNNLSVHLKMPWVLL